LALIEENRGTKKEEKSTHKKSLPLQPFFKKRSDSVFLRNAWRSEFRERWRGREAKIIESGKRSVDTGVNKGEAN